MENKYKFPIDNNHTEEVIFRGAPKVWETPVTQVFAPGVKIGNSGTVSYRVNPWTNIAGQSEIRKRKDNQELF